MIRTAIVDDDRFICASLKTILQADPEIDVIAMGSNGTEAVQIYENMQPDILLMDIRMGVMDGLSAGEAIIKTHPDARILFLTTFADNAYIIKALSMGAKGYLIKQNAEAIAPALKAVMSGQSVFGGEVVAKLPAFIGNQGRDNLQALGLSTREADIIERVSRGLNNKEIADALFLSEGTVRNYLSGILDKLGLRDRTQLAVFFYTGMR